MSLTKDVFLSGLETQLKLYGIQDTADIINDFEQHFIAGAESGHTEEQVCDKLGSPVDIAKQYAEEGAAEGETARHSTDELVMNIEQNLNQAAPEYDSNVHYQGQASQDTANQKSTSGISNGVNVGGLIGILCLDVFVLSWALPTLASLIVSLGAVALSLIIAAFGIAFNLNNVWSQLEFLSNVSIIFGAAVVLSLSGLTVVGTIGSVKGFIKLVKNVVNMHGTMIIGRKIFDINK